MELTIYNPSENDFLKEIKWNNEEIKVEVARQVEKYKSLVYTEDQLSDAKNDRATLNKFIAAIDAKRKEIKKKCLEPYELFEKQTKEITEIITEPLQLIDGWVKGFEDQRKNEKMEKIKEFFAEVNTHDFLILEGIFDPRWLNASVSFKKVCEDIKEQIERVGRDMETLQSLTEYSFEAIACYKENLDLNKALAESKRMVEIARAKQEAREREEAKRAERERQEHERKQIEEVQRNQAESIDDFSGFMNSPSEALQVAEDIPGNNMTQEGEWIRFEAYLNKEKAVLLKEFLDSNKIEFRRCE